MSSRLNRMWLLPFLLLVSQAWALGLGEIRLSSALNEPLRAEIELLAATADELDNLSISLASEETFARYDLDRPLFLSRLRFEMVRSGRADGNIIRVSSVEPVTEPFVTFLVEASWSRGRLLREYTILLDPPTFAPPPAAQSTQAVTAPTRATPSDAGQIQRQPAPQRQPTPAPSRPPVQAPVQSQTAPAVQPQPQPTPTQGQPSFDDSPGGDVLVVRGDTLWGITSRVRPDSRLTINQTMLAIFEANPQAFAGNINVMRAGATLRIPSADDVFRISRGDAFAEVQRHNEAWGGMPGIAPPVAQPSLTLVPPDEEDDIGLADDSIDTGIADLVDDLIDDAVVDPVDTRINEIQDILADQDALIEIPDNELAALRAELAELRGEEPPIEDVVDDEGLIEDDALDDEAVEDDVAVVDTAAPPVVTTPARDDGILDKIISFASNFWVWVGGALILTVLILVWFMRRAANRDDEDATGVWDALDADELATDSVVSTERLRALARDESESIVVVETEQQADTEALFGVDTMEAPVIEEPQAPVAEPPPVAESPLSDTGTNKSLEDTFSSETAINLDQSDPVAEADFHMAYGLYDQAADLINGALTSEPDRQDLLAKLCEIYFVWGNRDAFIDAAGRLKTAIGADDNPDWDKTVIMGQQIAGDHELFSGVSAEGATKAVDLSFEGGTDDAGELDIDFASEGGGDEGASDIIDLGGDAGDIIDLGGEASDIIDLGGDADDIIDLGGDADDGVSLTDTGQVSISPDFGAAIDFSVDEPDIDASITREMPQTTDDATSSEEATDLLSADQAPEEPIDESMAGTVETPTIEQQFHLEATGELPALTDDLNMPETDATAEINLDDLGLDIGDLDETAVETDNVGDDHIGDLEDTAQSQTLRVDDLDITGTSEAIDDELDSTSRNPTLSDEDATQIASFDDAYGDDSEDTDVGIDTSLLDATGQTQVLTEDMAVETASDVGASLSNDDATMLGGEFGDDDTIESNPDDAATLLAPLDDDDDGDFDFAKTEALPKDVFSPDMSTDETGRMPNLAGSTDMDLDLDDLTAALKVSEVGDTVNQMRDDATVEHPRIDPSDAANGDDSGETTSTQALAPEDLSGDLHEARTMTEVGTKLDLARAYVDMGDPGGARSILEEVLDEGDQGQKQQAQKLLDSLPS